MASTSVMCSRVLHPAMAFARRDVGSTSGRGGGSDRTRCSRVFSHDESSSRRAVAIERDKRTAHRTRRAVHIIPRASSRDAPAETIAGTSQAPHSEPTHPLWEISGRSSIDVKHCAAVGSSQTPPPMSPSLAAGVALLGGAVFALVSKRATAKREELELQRRFRGDLIRRRVTSAVGRNEYAEVDYAGDRVMSNRDIAFTRTQGLVRSDKSKPSPEDFRFLQESDEQNAHDARNAAAITRGEMNRRGSSRTVSSSTSSRAVAPSTRAPSEAQQVQVTLGVTCRVSQNQSVWVTGGVPSLGGWDLTSACQMDRVGQDRWQCSISVPPGALEYRYVLCTALPSGQQQMESEQGAVRSRIIVSDAYGAQLFVEEVAPVFDGNGGAGGLTQSSADALRDGQRRRSFSSDVNVAERLKGVGGQFERAAAAMGAPSMVGDDKTEVSMNDDVTVVEDFTDVSDDELAALVAELQRELAEGDK